MARITFDTIFTKHEDGSLEPKRAVKINGVVVRPGLRFKDTSFNGINLSDSQFLNHDLEVELDKDTIIITGIY